MIISYSRQIVFLDREIVINIAEFRWNHYECCDKICV